MYFIHNIQPGRIDLSAYSRIFDYRNLLYKDWREPFEEELRSNSTFICDLSAALLTKVYDSSYAHEDIFSKSLRCCEQIIEDLGYDSMDELSFYDEIKAAGKHIVLVAGCQNDLMIRGRAIKAGELCQKSRKNFDVVFSGLNPSSKADERNAIHNESAELKKHFVNYMRRNSVDLPKLHYLQFEPASNNTVTNVSEFFRKFMAGKGEAVNLYIVSSSFHLIRLAEAVKNI